MSTIDRDPLLGATIAGRYEVLRRIGRGGMGAIYEVKHLRLGRSFAVKTLTWEVAGNAEVVARFQREADVIAKLRHPNIVEIVDWDALPDGTPCLIMELLIGEDLAQRLKKGPLSWSAIARIGDEVLAALAVAHKAGIVHRDLKPQNIYLAADDSGEERAKLLDFGVSKIRGSQSFATTDARLIGTPAYMSPEQADGAHDDIGPATDVWAMGAILSEMATGRIAFEGASVPQILYRICHRGPEPIEKHRPDAPQPFLDLVAAALECDQAKRITDVDALRAGLRTALSGVPDVDLPKPMRAPSSAGPTPVSGVANTVALAPTTLSSSIGQSIAAPSVAATPALTRRRALPVVLGGVVIAAAAVIAVIAWPHAGDTQSAAPTPAPDASVRQPDPVPVPVPAPPPPPSTVMLTITSTPAGASVLDPKGRTPIGSTPYETDVPRGTGTKEFILELEGYLAKDVSLPTNESNAIEVPLVRVPSPTRPTKPKPPKSGTTRQKGTPVNPFGN